jgi:hypothetical protein
VISRPRLRQAPPFLLPSPSFPFRNSPDPRPRKNRIFLFMHLREPILQPVYFQIHAGMGGVPPFTTLARSDLQTLQLLFDLSSFFSNLHGHSYTTVTYQPLCYQSFTHSFHHDGGCTPSGHSSLRSSAYSASLRYLFPFSLPSHLSIPQPPKVLEPWKQMSSRAVLTVERGWSYGR